MRIAGLLLFSLSLAQDPGQAKVDEWIVALGDEEIETRERAQSELLRVGAPAVPSLRKAAEDPDLERACRARAVLARLPGKKEAAPGKRPPAKKAATDDEDQLFERWFQDPSSGRMFRVRFKHLSLFDSWFWPFWGAPGNSGG